MLRAGYLRSTKLLIICFGHEVLQHIAMVGENNAGIPDWLEALSAHTRTPVNIYASPTVTPIFMRLPSQPAPATDLDRSWPN